MYSVKKTFKIFIGYFIRMIYCIFFYNIAVFYIVILNSNFRRSKFSK
jgi:hypothetical protein